MSARSIVNPFLVTSLPGNRIWVQNTSHFQSENFSHKNTPFYMHLTELITPKKKKKEYHQSRRARGKVTRDGLHRHIQSHGQMSIKWVYWLLIQSTHAGVSSSEWTLCTPLWCITGRPRRCAVSKSRRQVSGDFIQIKSLPRTSREKKKKETNIFIRESLSFWPWSGPNMGDLEIMFTMHHHLLCTQIITLSHMWCHQLS